MNYSLLIVESPSKAKTISKYLGKDFKVCASYGHISNIPSKKNAVDTNNDFHTIYTIPDKSAKHLEQIIKYTEKSERVLLATDPDREGEAIAYHIAQEIKKNHQMKNVPEIQRITFNSITKNDILNALKKPRAIDMNLVDAQKTRQTLDYLVGFNLSPVLWRKVPGSMSAGRVQSVALRLISEKDDEIFCFKAEEFWTITGNFINSSGELLEAKLTNFNGKKLEKFSIANEAQSKEILNELKKNSFYIKEIKKKQTTSSPSAPFTTSSLQQDASTRLGFSPKKTMQIAQKLYEGIKIEQNTTGLITYMRTDGTFINGDFLQNMRQFIDKEFGKKYLYEKIRAYKSKVKNAQEAHEAIRPTNLTYNPEVIKSFLDEDQYKLYKLIWCRTLASQMSNAIFDQTNIIITSNDNLNYFNASGSVLKFDGFQKLYFTRDKDILLPICEENENLKIHTINDKQNFTQPPAHFSEASLIKKLEELGIGRPSTYTTILSVLQERKYITLEKKKLILDQRGKVVNAFLCHFFAKYVDYKFTASLENELDDISNGQKVWLNVMHNFWGDFIKNIETVMNIDTKEVAEKINEDLSYFLFPEDEEEGKDRRQCPECKIGKLGVRCSKFGVFLGCDNYPDCKYIKNISNNHEAVNDNIDNKYPYEIMKDERGESVMLCKGPYGLFLQFEDNAKTKRVTIPKSLTEDQLSAKIVNVLIKLPLSLGFHPENKKEIKVGLGRFGGYILYDGSYVSIKNELEVLSITIDEAIKKINEHYQKLERNLIKIIGHDKENNQVGLYKNRFGYFLLQGNKRIKLNKDMQTDDLSVDDLYAKKIIK